MKLRKAIGRKVVDHKAIGRKAIGRKAIVSLILLAFSAFAVMVAISFFFEPFSIRVGSQFEAVPVAVADYDINDIGVADVNQDGNLDIFTTNHSAQQSLLIGDGSGKFVDVLAERGLSQDRQFPKLENSTRSPKTDAPGLYIYRRRNLLYLIAHDTEAFGSVSGSIELSAIVELLEQSQATVEIDQTALPSGITASRIAFDLGPGGHLEIKTRESSSNKVVVEIPHQVQIDDSLPLSAIFVGREAVTPDSHRFELMWRDRHSMSWSDINNDGLSDVFIGRGGIHGKMRLFPEQYYDELFVNRGDTFEDQVLQFQLIKDDCSARQSAWVDFNGDGRLDIYNSCGRNASERVERPHQLFQQQPDGTFEDVAESVGLDLPKAGEFVWFDADGDSRPDVMTTQNRELSLYYNQGNTFTAEPLGDLADPRNKQFSVADFDQDGSLDVYVAGKIKSYLLQTDETNRYQLEDALEKGLPAYSLCANWVDYDNDGYSDLHTIPSGLYRQQPDHTFERVRLLSNEAAVIRERLSRLIGWERMRYQKARCSWLDYDNDGFRDFLIAQRRDSLFNRLVNRLRGRDPSEKWQARLFRNKGINQHSKAHWLSLVLKGIPGNLEAVGASVSIETSVGTQTQIVGSSEGSYFSQGHYRLYFGLGTDDQADTITINWPDGTSQILNDVAANQLLTIELPASEPRT
ncbi:CRTAC1 family protein [cf. Phormidesmis sp. LEGE 11477]|uniref:CRTAC1 family protein n=1 Tax=cf. Phormidesmis sp. LEGE 11477 TaxID=1828680 RepID=UPI00187FD645|nr:CRTAC1 family protein [cf. Phormidesmis sp. LEGE 11477]MBE9062327.1 CRTAC1 family protein [cf. Phormidesmis sp. LEGE 11477]